MIPRVLLPILLALCIVRLWVMPLGSSFWVDEAETAFVVHHGVDHPSLAIVPPAAVSLYYWLPRASEAMFGFSESVERMPSVIAMAIGLFFIGRLAARLIHPRAAWFAVFCCLTLRVFDYEAADARPYALGICVASASLWLLIRWLDSGKWLDCILFLAVGALVWRVHLVYWPFYLVYAIYFLARSDGKASWVQVVTVCGGLVLALLPVAVSALTMNRDAGLHVFAPLPSWSELGETFKIRLVAACALGGLILSRFLKWSRVDSVPSWPAIALIGAWWIVQPIGLFSYSYLSGISVFSSRYVSLSLPGVAWPRLPRLRSSSPKSLWQPLALVMGIAALIFCGQWNQLWPPHHNSDWRGAARAANALGLDPSTTVLVVSPFVEAKPPVWSPNYQLPGFLYCQWDVYPMNGTPYLFPYDQSTAAQQYAEELSKTTLSNAKRFLIYANGYDARRLREWFAARPEIAGWHNRMLGPFLDVDVALFQAQ